MNKLILFTMLFCPLATIAQKDTTQHKWAVGLQLSTPYDFTPYANEINLFQSPSQIKDYSAYSLGIKVNYLMNDYIFSLKAGFCDRTQTNYNYDTAQAPVQVQIVNETMKQSMFYCSLGIGRIFTYKFISLYSEIELPFVYYGLFTHNINTQLTNSGNFSIENSIVTESGGFSIGLGAFAGVDFSICKKISIGTEFELSAVYSKTGGAQTFHSWSTGYSTYNDTQTYIDTKQQLSISNLRPSFNIMYHF